MNKYLSKARDCLKSLRDCLKSLRDCLWTYFFYWIVSSIYYVVQMALCLILMAFLTLVGCLLIIGDLIQAIGRKENLFIVLGYDLNAMFDLGWFLSIHDEILINCGWKEEEEDYGYC